MHDDLNRLPSGLNGRGILAAMAASVVLLGVAPAAEAGEGHGRKHRHHHHSYAPGYVAVPPGHVHYYAPAPVVVYPAPVMYGPAYPVYGSPGGSVNLGISLPLR